MILNDIANIILLQVPLAKSIRLSGTLFIIWKQEGLRATPIENVPALIEKSPKIINLKLKDKCLFLYLHGHKLVNLEHELQRNVFSRSG